jgi:hypothetical protein
MSDTFDVPAPLIGGDSSTLKGLSFMTDEFKA